MNNERTPLKTIYHDRIIPAQGNLRRSVAAIKNEKIEDDWHTGWSLEIGFSFCITR